MKNNFKYNFVKFCYSIKGFFRTLFFFKKGKEYCKKSQKIYCVYRGNRTFFEYNNKVDTLYAFEAFQNNVKTYPYWQLGILQWEKA